MTAGGTLRERTLLGSNPAERTFGTRVLEAGDGWVAATAAVPPDPGSAAWLGPLADILVARAAMSRCPDPTRCVTIDLRVDFLTERPPAGGDAYGRGTVVDLDGGFGLAEATVEQADGRALARCVGRLRLVPGLPDDADDEQAGPDTRTPLPLPRLFGLAWRERTPERGSADVAGNPEVGNRAGVMHGGAQHSLLVVAAEEFARREAGSWRVLDATLSCLLPVPAHGPGLALEVTVAGRTRNLLRLGVEFRGAAGLLAVGVVAMRRVGA